MKKKKVYQVFFLYLTSYVIIAFLPIICIFFVYYGTVKENLRENVRKEEVSNVYNAMLSLESHLSTINGVPRQLLMNHAVQNYGNTGNTLSRASAIQELKNLAGGNEMFNNIFLYFRDYQTLVSAYSNSYDKNSVIDNEILTFEKIDNADFAEMLEHINRLRVIPAMKVSYAYQTSGRVVSFMQTLPENNSFARICMITFIDAGYLERLLDVDDKDYLLFDNKGQLVLWNENSGNDTQVLQERFNEADELKAEKSLFIEDDLVMTWTKSNTQGWTLVTFTSVVDMFNQLKTQRQKLLFLFLILSLFSTILIIYFMEKTYKPVNKLIKITADYDGEENATAFDLIENTLHLLQIENIQLSTRIENQNPVMIEHIARMLLSTPEAQWDQQLYERGRKIGLNLSCDNYQVLILQYDLPENMQKSLYNIVECCRGEYIVSFAETGKKYIVLVLGNRNTKEPLYQQVNLTALHASCIAVGPCVNSVRRWNESYVCALLTYSMMRAENSSDIVCYEDIPMEAYASYPWVTVQSFAAAVNHENSNMVREVGKEIVKLICSNLAGTLEKRQMIFCQTIILFQKELPEYFEWIDQYIKRVLLHDPSLTMKEMGEVLKRIISEYCESIDKKMAEKENSPIYRSLGIINENIGSQDLSISSVAERVGMSVSRYSTLFHQEMNCNFKEYVDTLRVNRAKQLLVETDMIVSDIALQVGYSNSYSFTRLFKRYTDTTPSEYRMRDI